MLPCMTHTILLLTLIADAAAAENNRTEHHRCIDLRVTDAPPSHASLLLRKQIETSLAHQSYIPGDTNFTTVFDESKTWQDFAGRVGTQDFCYSLLSMHDGDLFVLFDYGLGDNDFGSIHPWQAVAAAGWVTDGDWSLSASGKSLLTEEGLQCLEDAVATNDCFQRN